MEKNVVLCGASRYEEKYYLNPDFAKLPGSIQDELKILCVLFTQEIGGSLTLEFEPDGTLCLRTEAKESDFNYDEIGGVLKIKEIQREKRELFEALEMYYKTFFLHS